MPVASRMRAAARRLLDLLADEPRQHALRPLDDQRLRWLEYRPRPRPGVSLADLDGPARKAAHRLLATGLRPHAYAQAMSIMALEEVLDRAEGWRRGRHSGDFWVVIFGEPEREAWAWRFEGHHLSVTMAVTGDEVHPTPLFLGANPAAVGHAGRTVIRPLAAEEDLARALLAAMAPAARGTAVVAGRPPPDIRSGPRPQISLGDAVPGVAGARLDPPARALLVQLTTVYLDRLPEPLALRLVDRLDPAELHFAWEGSTSPGHGHYYRIMGPELLIEYDNTADGANHMHTVLRRPGGDFGGDVLAAHLAADHPRGRA